MPAVNVSEVLNTTIGKFSLGHILSALVVLLVCLLVVRVVLKLVKRLLSRSKLDEQVRKYVLTGIKAILYVLTALITAGSLGVDMTSLVALLSVASLGITLAAEDILGNVAGGLVILSSHPFKVGDLIEADGTIGAVREISLNHTKLETPDGQLVLLPNQELASSKIINYTELGHRRIVKRVTASYDAPTETVKAACQQAVNVTANILDDPAPAVYLTNYGSSSIEYAVYCWVEPDNYGDTGLALGEALRTAFADHGVKMTYDHLNVHIIGEKL